MHTFAPLQTGLCCLRIGGQNKYENKENHCISCVPYIYIFIKSILKSLVILAIWLALSGAIYSRIAPFFALNRIFFSANENGTVKQNNQSDFNVQLK